MMGVLAGVSAFLLFSILLSPFPQYTLLGGGVAGVFSSIIVGLVIPKITGRKYEFSHLLLGFGSVYVLTVALVGAAYPTKIPGWMQGEELPQEVAEALRNFFGIPLEWLYMPAIFYLFVIPFLGLLAIVEGFLDPLKDIWGNWIHLIAFAIAFLSIPTGIFGRIVGAMFAAMGIYSVFAFGFLFFFAVIYTVIKTLRAGGFTSSETYKELEVELEQKAR